MTTSDCEPTPDTYRRVRLVRALLAILVSLLTVVEFLRTL
jgi:hypothetical protein